MSRTPAGGDPRRPASPNSVGAAAGPPAPPEDSFVAISGATFRGLGHAALECGWIADGGDPSATFAQRDLAAVRQLEYRREKIRVAERTLAYLTQGLSVVPPSPGDLEAAKQLAIRLGKMRDVNVKVVAVITAATELLTLYGKTGDEA